MIAHRQIGADRLQQRTAHDLVYGDPARLRQLFMVLLDNAVRYSNSKGEVKVAVASDNGEVRVRVADHGIGIPPEELEGIFERFRRGGNASSIMKKV